MSNTIYQSLKEIPFQDLQLMLDNKKHAVRDLSTWLSRHANNDEGYLGVVADRNKLNQEITSIEFEISNRK